MWSVSSVFCLCQNCLSINTPQLLAQSKVLLPTTRQLCRIRRCVNDAHVDEFVTSRVDYCGSFESSVRCHKEDWQASTCRHAAMRIISNTRKCDRSLSHFRRNTPCWLDIVDRVRSRLCVQIYRCLLSVTSGYQSALYWPTSSVPGRRHLQYRMLSLFGSTFRDSDYYHIRWPSIHVRRSVNLELASFLRSGQFTVFVFISTSF